MATTYTLRVEGLNKAVRDLEGLGVEVDDLKAAFTRIADEGTRTMRRHIPARSGDLRGDARPSKSKNRAVVTVGRKSVPYAAAMQWGWGPMARSYKHGRRASGIRGTHPGADFFAKTDAEMEPKALRMLEDEINKQIRKHGLS